MAGTLCHRAAVRMLAAGGTILAVAESLGVSPAAVYRARRRANLPRCWHPLSDAERRRIRSLLLADHSRREVARITNRGLGTVARVGLAMQGQHGTAGPVRVRSPYRCPGCGLLLTIRPCVFCRCGQTTAEDLLAVARKAA